MRAIEHNLFFRKCFKSYFWFYLKLGGQTNIVKAISKLSRCAGEDSQCLSHQGSIYGEADTVDKDLEERRGWEGKRRDRNSCVEEQ